VMAYSPHARGGEPASSTLNKIGVEQSPRPWG